MRALMATLALGGLVMAAVPAGAQGIDPVHRAALKDHCAVCCVAERANIAAAAMGQRTGVVTPLMVTMCESLCEDIVSEIEMLRAR